MPQREFHGIVQMIVAGGRSALETNADPKHLHFGSDWPFTPTKICIGLAEALDGAAQLNGPLRADVYRNNALRLFAPAQRREDVASR